MVDSQLFRIEALEAQRVKWHGEIILTRPISYSVLALLAASIAGALVLFAIFSTYTKRVTVNGQLIPDKGLVKVYAQQASIVVQQRVVEGKDVEAGDVLFVLSSERHSSTGGETQASISRENEIRKRSLGDEVEKVRRLALYDRTSLSRKIGALYAELDKLASLTQDQNKRYALSVADYARYEEVKADGYVSQDQLAQKQADMIDQKSRLESLERDAISTKRTLIDAQYQLDTLSIKYANQIGDIERNIASVEQDLSESEARRALIVVAPESGTATAITVHEGQLIDVNKPLVAIIPTGSSFQAELYAPSRAVGFVRTGDIVHMRYQAFPYQKFGQYRGTVTEVATTALSSTELTGTSGFATSGSEGAEPLYRILVHLEVQNITAYDQQRPLHIGMLLEADILQETRRLYEWALEPLYTLSHKL